MGKKYVVRFHEEQRLFEIVLSNDIVVNAVNRIGRVFTICRFRRCRERFTVKNQHSPDNRA